MKRIAIKFISQSIIIWTAILIFTIITFCDWCSLITIACSTYLLIDAIIAYKKVNKIIEINIKGRK